MVLWQISKCHLLVNKKDEAIINLGETEIRDALYAKAEYLCQIGDKVCTDNGFDFLFC